jgi:hypothetical protein
LFGSGETTPSGQKIFNHLFARLLERAEGSAVSVAPAWPRVAVLETPAGFELNSPQVAGRVADFLRHHLQNYAPHVTVIPARKRGAPFSPDDLRIAAPLLDSDLIFMGPGSPTYAVRQLHGSLAWDTLLARHRLGAALALASAATVAASAFALPVYEIYKVGENLHWKLGLDLFGPFGLALVFIPHWNNADGGEELDTSRCFIGRSRFDRLLRQLPAGMTIVGIDEQTGLMLDPLSGICQVIGKGSVTVLRAGNRQRFRAEQAFPVAALGDFRLPEPPEAGLPAPVWRRALAAGARPQDPAQPPAEVLALVAARQAARSGQDWEQADDLRARIAELGWQVVDTEAGPVLEEVIS